MKTRQRRRRRRKRREMIVQEMVFRVEPRTELTNKHRKRTGSTNKAKHKNSKPIIHIKMI